MQHGSIARSAASNMLGLGGDAHRIVSLLLQLTRSAKLFPRFLPQRGGRTLISLAAHKGRPMSTRRSLSYDCAAKKGAAPGGEGWGGSGGRAERHNDTGEKTRWRVVGNSSLAHVLHSALTLRAGLGLYRVAAKRELRSHPSAPCKLGLCPETRLRWGSLTGIRSTPTESQPFAVMAIRAPATAHDQL
jgi:hypothetical protein